MKIANLVLLQYFENEWMRVGRDRNASLNVEDACKERKLSAKKGNIRSGKKNVK